MEQIQGKSNCPAIKFSIQCGGMPGPKFWFSNFTSRDILPYLRNGGTKMSAEERYDIVIVGGGPNGTTA
ncbi:MAG: hypothetical protein KAT53_01805, partial [Dehalococcoidia bacterium]|nr:hypothetical protein [Dehalococcoidia bacterium]